MGARGRTILGGTVSLRHAMRATLVTTVGGSALAVVPILGTAYADVDAPAAAAALDLPAGVTVTGTTGDPMTRAVADTVADPDTRFNDFPAKGSSYLLLSTGDAGKVFEGVPTSQLSTDIGGDEAPDESSVTLTVAAGTPNAGCLFVDFALGTEEVIGLTSTKEGDDDELTIASGGTDRAVNAGDGYFAQDDPDTPGSPDWPASTKPHYQVNQLRYWHKPGDSGDPLPGTAEDPYLPAVTGLNNVTTRDTARVPIDVSGGAVQVTLRVSDAPAMSNGDLDSVGFFDNVRLRTSCANNLGVEPHPDNRETPAACCGVIRGIRGVGNALVYDPVPSTDEIERYDSPANGWRSPSNVPVELRFRWYRTTVSYRYYGDMRRWEAIPNADRQSYVPTAVDRSKVLIVLVTGVVDGRRYETFPSTNDAATWYVTTAIQNGTFQESVAPVISGPADGSPSVGETLTAQIGNTVPRQDTYTWQWFAKNPGTAGLGSAISGATSQSLVLGDAQAGKVVTVQATAKRDQFDAKDLPSDPYGPVELQSWQDKPTPVVVSDGSPKVGETLSVDTGAWQPTPASYSYQWKRNGAVISGATTATYLLKSGDVGTSISVDVSGVLTGYPQAPRPSAGVSIAGDVMTGAPVTISGIARVGARLTGAATGWQPNTASLNYQWYVGATLVQYGIKNTLVIPASAAGQRITLKVTGTRAGYDPLTRASAPSGVVARGTLSTGSVAITGTPRVGQTVRAYVGGWSPAPVVVAYRWKIGASYVTGAAGTLSYLKLPARARGKRITLVVTIRKTGYNTVVRSVASGVVR